MRAEDVSPAANGLGGCSNMDADERLNALLKLGHREPTLYVERPCAKCGSDGRADSKLAQKLVQYRIIAEHTRFSHKRRPLRYYVPLLATASKCALIGLNTTKTCSLLKAIVLGCA